MSNKSNDCGIVRDLLPLYADGEASKESSLFIEEHMAGCEECRRAYRQYTKIPHTLELAPPRGKNGKYHYSEVARRIRRRNTIKMSAVCSVFLIFGFIISRILFSDKK